MGLYSKLFAGILVALGLAANPVQADNLQDILDPVPSRIISIYVLSLAGGGLANATRPKR